MIIPTTTTITYPTAWGSGGWIAVAVASLLCSWSWGICSPESSYGLTEIKSKIGDSRLTVSPAELSLPRYISFRNGDQFIYYRKYEGLANPLARPDRPNPRPAR